MTVRRVVKQVTNVAILSLTLLAVLATPAHAALTETQKDSIRNGTAWYKINNSVGCSATTEGEPLDVSDVEGQTWNFLTGKGLTGEQAAGVMGNLEAESGFDTNAIEFGNNIGFGLAQWSFGRRTALEAAAATAGKQPGDLAFQLEYLYEELNLRSIDRSEYRGIGSSEWEGLTKQATVDDALVFFHHEFEISYLIDQPDPRQAVIDNRGGITTPNGKRGAQFFFDTYGGQSCGGATGDVVMPVDPGFNISGGFVIASSEYSSGYHKGTDYAIDFGTPVYAIADGTVVEKITDSYGNTILSIQHADGLRSRYWHIDWQGGVDNGTAVAAGQQVGTIGMHGQTSGPHLHFELSVAHIEGFINTVDALPGNETYAGITNVCSKTTYYGCGFIDGDEYLKKYASNYP